MWCIAAYRTARTQFSWHAFTRSWKAAGCSTRRQKDPQVEGCHGVAHCPLTAKFAKLTQSYFHHTGGPISYGGLLTVRGEMVSKEGMSASTAQSAVATVTSNTATSSRSSGFDGEASSIARCTRMNMRD